MAKKVIMVDRFRIHAEVSAEAMGPLLATLARIGLENIGYELVTDVRTFGSNGPRTHHDVNHREFAIAYVREHARFRSRDFAKYFVEAGRSKNSSFTVLSNLARENIIRRSREGEYVRVEKLEGPPPTPGKKPSARIGRSVPKYEVKNFDFILGLIAQTPKFTMVGMQDALKIAGRNPKSVSPVVSQMKAKRLVKMIAHGQYEATEKGLKAAAAVKRPSHLNGSTNNTESQHGEA